MSQSESDDQELVKELQGWIDNDDWDLNPRAIDEQACWKLLEYSFSGQNLAVAEAAFKAILPESPSSPTHSPSFSQKSFERNEVAGESSSNLQDVSARYLPIKHVGAGGFGVVIHARDVRLDRNVAIKMVRPSMQSHPGLLQRFAREARAVASFSYPGIVSIYETGFLNGLPLMVCEYVSGTNLATHLEKVSSILPERQAAWLIENVARSVHYAHSRGILHRDLKPSNILLEPAPNEETESFGFKPRLTDFGLAKRFDGVSDLTDDLTVDSIAVGTIRYMSPEQVRGQQQDITITSDVYTLGVILYQLVVGKVPFDGASFYDVSERICRHEAIPVHKAIPGSSRDLSAIIHKCLSKNSADRYASAAELADDLNRFLNGYPVNATRPSLLKTLRYWIRSSPRTALAVALGTVGVGVAMYTVNAAWLREREAHGQAEDNLKRAIGAIDDIFQPITERLNEGRPITHELHEELLRSSVEFQQFCVRAMPTDYGVLHRLSVAHNFCSNGYVRLGKRREAYEQRLESIRILERLLKLDPTNSERYHFDLFFGYHMMAMDNFASYYPDEDLMSLESASKKAGYHISRATYFAPENVDYQDAYNASIYFRVTGGFVPNEDIVPLLEKLVASSHDLWKLQPEKTHLAKYSVLGNRDLAINALKCGEYVKADYYMQRWSDYFQDSYENTEAHDWTRWIAFEYQVLRSVTSYRVENIDLAKERVLKLKEMLDDAKSRHDENLYWFEPTTLYLNNRIVANLPSEPLDLTIPERTKESYKNFIQELLESDYPIDPKSEVSKQVSP